MPDAILTNHPPIPDHWLARTEVHGGDGTLPHCICLRQIDGLHPFVVHTAIVHNGVWSYEHGKYSADKAAAMQTFLDTATRYGYRVV